MGLSPILVRIRRTSASPRRAMPLRPDIYVRRRHFARPDRPGRRSGLCDRTAAAPESVGGTLKRSLGVVRQSQPTIAKPCGLDDATRRFSVVHRWSVSLRRPCVEGAGSAGGALPMVLPASTGPIGKASLPLPPGIIGGPSLPDTWAIPGIREFKAYPAACGCPVSAIIGGAHCAHQPDARCVRPAGGAISFGWISSSNRIHSRMILHRLAQRRAACGKFSTANCPWYLRAARSYALAASTSLRKRPSRMYVP